MASKEKGKRYSTEDLVPVRSKADSQIETMVQVLLKAFHDDPSSRFIFTHLKLRKEQDAISYIFFKHMMKKWLKNGKRVVLVFH